MAEAFLLGEDPTGTPRVISILSSLVQRAADRNDSLAAGRIQSPPNLVARAFLSPAKPAISIRDYLDRIFLYSHCSPSCYVVAFIYLDRFLHFHPSLAVDSFNVHRLLITAVLTAVKFMEDRFYDNAYFARVGGISLAEMNYLEVDFLFGVRFELNVTPIVFTSYCSILQREVNLLNPQIPPRMPCLPSEEEPCSNNCHNKQLTA
ncbi:Cyclin-P4-1 [Apostasia shenzhenica]|uniref:Cyclin n=1 Tax=Apostasia shenzhenica TaxID=1088818 RepID=A0A2I0ACP5_9ASPA|nr:Cyclin-P4-1 [Apostasia shenzhenica]